MELYTDPCPFCGGTDVGFYAQRVEDESGVESFYGYAVCGSCHAEFANLGFGVTPEDAVFEGKVHWNQRPQKSCLMKRNVKADFDVPIYTCTECGCDVEWKPEWPHCPICGCLVEGVAS